MNNETKRLYYSDSYRTSFQARVIETAGDPCRIVLDRTAFYPASGGQPSDRGTLGSVPILDVVEDEGRVVHVLESPPVSAGLEGEIDWSRRFDHMQQHTGQHLLSAVIADLFGIATISFHMGQESSTIDLLCRELTQDQLQAAELRANAVVQENRPVHVAVEDAKIAAGLRKPTDRTGPIRVVTIEGLDLSACGGTHVRATGEIGFVQLRSTEKIRGDVRLEFLCGSRAVRRARADYVALDQAARTFTSALEDVPGLIAVQQDRVKELDKACRRLEAELAGQRGRALHANTPADSKGLRVAERRVEKGPFLEDLRYEASAFVGEGKAIFLALSNEPRAVLLASSADSGVHCGNLLKAVFADYSGRGGGSQQIAQGTFSGDAEGLRTTLLAALAI